MGSLTVRASVVLRRTVSITLADVFNIVSFSERHDTDIDFRSNGIVYVCIMH